MKLYSVPGLLGIAKENEPPELPVATLVHHEAEYTFWTNKPIQSPLIDLETACQVTVNVLPAVIEVGTFRNATAKEE